MANRKTIQKEHIVIAIENLFHPTADEVCKKIQELFGAVSVATVYRNLKLMVACGELKKIESIGRADRFDKTTSDHCHFFCNCCGKLFDIKKDFLPNIDLIKNDQGFLIDTKNITFSGLCAYCQKKV